MLSHSEMMIAMADDQAKRWSGPVRLRQPRWEAREIESREIRRRAFKKYVNRLLGRNGNTSPRDMSPLMSTLF
jgi:hypothetical protein